MIAYIPYKPHMLNVSGAIIIEKEEILLVREEKSYGSTIFMLPGGKFDEQVDKNVEDTCRREVREEVGVELENMRLFHTMEQIRPLKEEETVLLYHYIADRIGEISPGEEVLEWGWYSIDNLPKNVAPNIPIIIEKYKTEFNI